VKGQGGIGKNEKPKRKERIGGSNDKGVIKDQTEIKNLGRKLHKCRGRVTGGRLNQMCLGGITILEKLNPLLTPLPHLSPLPILPLFLVAHHR